MRNVRDLIRDWCARTGYPVSDLIGRGRAAREGGLILKGGHGINAPDATPRDGAMLLLSTIVGQFWKDVAKELKKYGNLVKVKAEYISASQDDFFVPDEWALWAVLTKALEKCGSERKIRFHLLRVTRSEIKPEAYLELAVFKIDETGDTRTGTIKLFFEANEQTGQRAEGIRASYEIDDRFLNAMADLLAPNIAAANRARSPAGKNETSPPVPTGRPAPPDASEKEADETSSQGANPGNDGDETPRGANPEAAPTHLEASDTETESQVGFESPGDSSGRASAATRKENPHDDVRDARAGSAQPGAP
jgi:hypothetical protein